MATQPRLLKPWRRIVQWIATICIITIPFIRISGQSLIRIDIPSLTLHFFGAVLYVEELYLFWLLCFSLIFLFLIVTFVLGRVWCGWACPQTTLNDLAEGIARFIGLRVTHEAIKGKVWRKIFLHCCFALIACLFGANLVWYFVSPYDYFFRLLAGTLGPWPLGTTFVLAVLTYGDLAFVRRLICKEFCPYGRFQTVLVDPGTLTLRYHPDEAPRCIDCHACVRACPMGIDIRKGFQIECINCAQCLDACRQVMAKRHEQGIIRYTFGTTAKGWHALLNIRLATIFIVFLIVSISLVIFSTKRSVASLKVSRNAVADSRYLKDDTMVTFFNAFLANKNSVEHTYVIRAFLQDGSEAEVKGQTTNIELQAGKKKRLDFAVITRKLAVNENISVRFVAMDEKDEIRAEAEAFAIGKENEKK